MTTTLTVDPRDVTEEHVHKAVVRWLHRCAPHVLFWHTPNANPRGDLFLGSRMKALGVRAGIHDILILPPNSAVLHGFEIKRPKGGTVSPEQKAFGRRLEDGGGHWAVIKSIDDARAAFEAWGIPTIDEAPQPKPANPYQHRCKPFKVADGSAR